MRIITTAMKDTGDLWLFNITRLICQQFGSVYGVEEGRYYEHEAKHFDFEIIKATEFDTAFTIDSVIVTTTRKAEDFITSDCEKGGLINSYYQQSLWNGYTNGVIKYETIIEDPRQAIKEVAYAIDMQCNEGEILEQLERIKAPSRGYDNKTLMYKTSVL